jgi:hypothetical protein
MLGDTLLWIVVVGALAAFGIAYATPATRPYAKKYWWVFVAVAASAAAFALLRRQGGHKIDDDIEEGREIADENMGAIDGVIDYALEQQAAADVELERKRLDAELGREVVDAELEAIKTVDDSVARRKALIALAAKKKEA